MRISDEIGIGALTECLWDEKLRPIEGKRTGVPNGQTSGIFDGDLFDLSWKPYGITVHSIRNESREGNYVRKALEAFLSVCWRVTSFFIASPTDAVLSSLCIAATRRKSALEVADVLFPTSIKAHIASWHFLVSVDSAAAGFNMGDGRRY